MVTADDIRRVRVFADLESPACERLSRAAADISLAPGEYAANEGDDPALFGLLEGRIEVVKLVDGIERHVGERLPGELIGEVPITLGTPYPVSAAHGRGIDPLLEAIAARVGARRPDAADAGEAGDRPADRWDSAPSNAERSRAHSRPLARFVAIWPRA